MGTVQVHGPIVQQLIRSGKDYVGVQTLCADDGTVLQTIPDKPQLLCVDAACNAPPAVRDAD